MQYSARTGSGAWHAWNVVFVRSSFDCLQNPSRHCSNRQMVFIAWLMSDESVQLHQWQQIDCFRRQQWAIFSPFSLERSAKHYFIWLYKFERQPVDPMYSNIANWHTLRQWQSQRRRRRRRKSTPSARKPSWDQLRIVSIVNRSRSVSYFFFSEPKRIWIIANYSVQCSRVACTLPQPTIKSFMIRYVIRQSECSHNGIPYRRNYSLRSSVERFVILIRHQLALYTWTYDAIAFCKIKYAD